MTRRTAALLAGAILTGSQWASGSTVNSTWTGGVGANSNASGSWGLASNWNTGAVPNNGSPTNATYNVTLDNVASGNRIVTVDSGYTIQSLTLNQTTIGATNTLLLDSTLTITTSGSSALTTTGTPTVDLNGQTLDFTNNISTGVIFTGPVLFDVANSTIENVRGSANSTIYTFAGAVTVNASGNIAQDAGTTNGNLADDTVNFTSNALVNINSGTLTVYKSGNFGSISVSGSSGLTSISNAGVLNISNGAGLADDDASATGSGNGTTTFDNASTGVITQAGALALTSRGSQGLATITNEGIWSINGTAATLSRASAVANPTSTPTFTISSTGTLQGSSSSDSLEYDDLVTTSKQLSMVNNGSLSPGAGTGSAGLASVGLLTLKAISLTLGGPSTMYDDVGGTTAGQFDQLKLVASSPAAAGSIAFGGTLSVDFVNGFSPAGNFSIPIADYASDTGTFATLLVNGTSNSQYSVAYGSTEADLVFTSTPEPGCVGMIAVGGSFWMARRRRGQRAAC